MSNYKSSKLSNIMLAIVLILVATLVVGAVLGIVKGKDNADTPVDNVQTNPLDEIKPVDKLTSDMWVTGWLIDPAKEPNMDKVNAFIANNVTTSNGQAVIMKPIDFDTLNFNSTIVGSEYDPSCGALVVNEMGFSFASAVSDSSFIFSGVYVFKGTESHAMFGTYGWLHGSIVNITKITEKTLVELPCAMKYDCTNYDIVKEFLTPVVDEKHECVKPAPLDDTRLIKGLRVKEVGRGFDISDSDLKCGDEFFKGTVAYNPLGIEIEFSGFRLVQEDNSIYLYGIFGGQPVLYNSVYYTSDNESLDGYVLKHISFGSKSILFPNGVLYKFDNEEYMSKKLWRFFEPIYAEKIADSAEKNLVAYNVDWSKVGYVNIESNYSKNSFVVQKHSYSHNFTEISTQVTLKLIEIRPPYSIGATNTQYFYFYENLDQVREIMTQLNYEGTLAEFIRTNFNTAYHDNAEYGVLAYSASNSIVPTMIDWLNANGFEDAVTPIYSQYK